MKKYILLTIMLVLSVVVNAESISKEKAEQLARGFLTERGMYGVGALQRAVPQQARARAQLKGSLQDACYYVFNIGQNQGFVIVSGDDRAPAVLGYSDKGAFDMDHLPSNVAAWLEGYADQIRYLRQHAPAAEQTAPAAARSAAPKMTMARAPWAVPKGAKTTIPTMITTKWDQWSPFNDLCPTIGTEKCVPGCIATALAQIMYYHKWPQSATAAIPKYTATNSGKSYPGLPATTFNWAAMNDNPGVGTPAGAAVALLIQYCAYGCKADFGLGDTPIYNNEPENALKNYFHYGAGVKYVERQTYSNEDWEKLIYTELEAKRPVLYSGQSNKGGGHAFVVHGYDNGFYAVNWGWGQSVDQDGYYLLDAMDPADLGIGGGSGGYNLDQTAIVGISKDDVETYQVVDDKVVLTTNYIVVDNTKEYYPISYYDFDYYEVTFNCQFVNKLSNTYSFDWDFKLYKDGVYQGLVFDEYVSPMALPPSYFFPYPDDMTLDLFGLTPGKWKLVPVSRKSGESEYYENINSDKYYLTAVVSADKKLKLYVGEPEGTEPDPQEPDPQEPEVTQEQLDQLVALVNEASTQLTTLYDFADAKHKSVTGCQSTIKTLSEDMTPIVTQLNTIMETLQKDEFLTGEEKTAFNNRRNQLVLRLNAISDVLLALVNKDIPEALQTVSSVNDDIIKINGTLSEQASLITTITKKEDLEKTQKLIENCIAVIVMDTKKLEAIDTDAMETTLKELSTLEDIVKDTKTLSNDIDKAIADAKESASQKEEQQKLAKAMERFNNAFGSLKTQIQNHQAAYDKKLDSLKGLIEQMDALNTTIETVETKIAELEKLIEENRPAAKSRAMSAEDYEGALVTLAELKGYLDEFKDDRDLISGQITTLQKYAADVEKVLNAEKTEFEKASDWSAQEVLRSSEEVNAWAQSLVDFATNSGELFAEEIDILDKAIDIVSLNVNNANEYAANFINTVDLVQSLVDEAIAAAGISTLKIDESEILGRYDLQGRQVDSHEKGVQIIRLKNGQTRKIYVK